jgi:tetratricopeptide (TPR) repeat protein
LRHIIETSDSLSFCLILTARNDETVRDNSFAHFVSGLELTQFPGFDFIDLPDMTADDAKELVVTTLRWPELLAQDSKTLELIVQRAGTNPFFLMQTLDHLAVDRGTVAFGHGDLYFLIDIPAFKRALRELPSRIRDILGQRFAGLLQHGQRKLLRALAATAIIGRYAPRRLVSRALRQPLSAHEVGRLLTLGYLADASEQSFELAHDLLAEALRERPEAQQVASSLASSIQKKAIRGLTEEQKASIYYAAGRRYYQESWNATRHLVESRARRQEYQSLPPLFERLERIASVSRTSVFDSKLSWLAAIVDQHCGSTYAALQRFLKIKEAAERVLPQHPERYIDALIEIGNQHLLRAEATPALQNISLALEILNDSALHLSAKDRSGLETLAQNRYGAVLHLLERHEEALEHFKLALAKADGTGHHYLRSHTHWNIAALLRFSDPEASQQHLQMARSIWNEKLRQRDRLGILIECSEAYVECDVHNTHLSRARLRAIAAHASEKGYLFQACNALLCFASCALKAEQWLDARQVLLRALDLTVTTEDLRSRIFVTHYMSISAHMLGAEAECRDWAWQAISGLTDSAFKNTLLMRCLKHNKNVTNVRSAEAQSHYVRPAGDLLWYSYERA